MEYPSPWEHEVAVVRHHHYDRKPTFEQKVDTYEEWAAFAVEDGKFEYEIGETSGVAVAEQMMVCPPGLAFHRRTDQPITFHFFLFHWVDQQGRPLPPEGYSQGIQLSFQAADRLHSSLSSLRSPAFAQHPTYRLWLNHALLDLFRLHSMEGVLPPTRPTLVSPDSQMEEARRILSTACDEPLTISAVAASFGLSSVQFSRRFQRAYGMKPSTYIESIKLDKVCHLLTHTQMTIEQVAQACSYNNGFYLSRYFSSKMKMSPSQFRGQHRV